MPEGVRGRAMISAQRPFPSLMCVGRLLGDRLAHQRRALHRLVRLGPQAGRVCLGLFHLVGHLVQQYGVPIGPFRRRKQLVSRATA